MSEKLDTRVIQVTNIAPSCTNEQMRTLFSYLGRVRELKMYPPENTEGVVARVAYIEFDDTTTTGVALHLSGTVFIDRALMVVPVMDGKIPDEHTALQLTPQAVAGMLPGQPTWPANVVSQVTGTGINQVITTYDPRLTSLGLPQYPPLPASTDASKIEEIRRTIYVSDLDPAVVTAEMLLNFFSSVGEIKYIRLAGDERAAARGAYIEFTDQRSVAQALTYNNVAFQGRTMSVVHSKANIVKPLGGRITEASQREIDEAMKKVKEASKLISAAASESRKDSSRSPSRKRSRSKSKVRSRSPSRRSRSRSKGRRRRTRSRSRRRSRSRHRSPRRSRSPVRRRRSRSRGRIVPSAPPLRRSRSRDRRRSRTRSPVRRRRSRTRSKSRRRSRTPPRSYSKRSRSRSRRKSISPVRRRSRSRDRKEKAKEKKKSPSLSPPLLERSGSVPPKNVETVKDDSPVKVESSPPPVLPTESAPSANAEGDSGKTVTKKRSPTPIKPRRSSPAPRKRSRSKSPSRRKRRRRTRSPTPRKRSRTRSGSRNRSKRERSKRSRSRERRHESKKKSTREKEEKKKDTTSTAKIKRDYDEEEKGFASGSEKERGVTEERSLSPPTLEAGDKDSDHQPVDMDMSD
ncbi:probable splicing factor, arginine/serine-rich 7 isoform X3 [Physella acuta]|uniref:probable splicing factor, arginine/serine-rich 7 isoform X3 n=1 Tax=Physella acuta TaxID=109671 RepID=UPI0027DCA94E|nr:probable splicing factor, arginine/serine-rich 7 isoform X3 [Physella acuta]